MRISHAFFLLTLACFPAFTHAAQAPSNPAPAPSSLLQPSLDSVQQTLSALRLEKWKRGTVREEAARDIGSILRDLQENVPPLLQAADAAPKTLSKELPLSRHIDALYDVLLRVEEAARIAAPGEQAAQLQRALRSLSDARLALDGQMQESAAAQEKQLSDLQSALRAQAAVKCPVVPVPACKPAAPPQKHHKKRKPSPGTQQKSAAPATPKKTQ